MRWQKKGRWTTFRLVDVDRVEKVLEEAVSNPHNDKIHVKTEVNAALYERFEKNVLEEALVESFLEAPLPVSLPAFVKLQNELKKLQHPLFVLTHPFERTF